MAQPLVQVSPTCGPAVGFNIVVNANGFEPDSELTWMFVDSRGQIPLYGYFQTNSTGGFNDVTFADDLPSDSYKMYFGTDHDNDVQFDPGTETRYVDIDIPCPTVQQQPLNQASSGVNWGAVCRILDSYITEPCETLTTTDGYTLTEEGKKVIACFLGGALLLMADKTGQAAAAAKALAPLVKCG